MALPVIDPSQLPSSADSPDLLVAPSVLPPISAFRRNEPSFNHLQSGWDDTKRTSMDQVRAFLRGQPTQIVDGGDNSFTPLSRGEDTSAFADPGVQLTHLDQLKQGVLKRLNTDFTESIGNISFTHQGEDVLRLASAWSGDKSDKGKNKMKQGVRLLLLPLIYRNSEILIEREHVPSLSAKETSESVDEVYSSLSDDYLNQVDKSNKVTVAETDTQEVQEMQNSDIHATLNTDIVHEPEKVGGRKKGIKAFFKGLFRN